MLLEALERWMTLFSDELSRIVVGDRGFDSKKNRCLLEKKGITNAICSRNPSVLKEQLQEKSFCKYQKRRASTEARIAIFVFIQVLENAVFLKFKIIHNKRLATVFKQSISGALI